VRLPSPVSSTPWVLPSSKSRSTQNGSPLRSVEKMAVENRKGPEERIRSSPDTAQTASSGARMWGAPLAVSPWQNWPDRLRNRYPFHDISGRSEICRSMPGQCRRHDFVRKCELDVFEFIPVSYAKGDFVRCRNWRCLNLRGVCECERHSPCLILESARASSLTGMGLRPPPSISISAVVTLARARSLTDVTARMMLVCIGSFSPSKSIGRATWCLAETWSCNRRFVSRTTSQKGHRKHGLRAGPGLGTRSVPSRKRSQSPSRIHPTVGIVRKPVSDERPHLHRTV